MVAMDIENQILKKEGVYIYTFSTEWNFNFFNFTLEVMDDLKNRRLCWLGMLGLQRPEH